MKMIKHTLKNTSTDAGGFLVLLTDTMEEAVELARHVLIVRGLQELWLQTEVDGQTFGQLLRLPEAAS